MGERTWANLLAALLRGEELSTSDTAWAMREIMGKSSRREMNDEGWNGRDRVSCAADLIFERSDY